MEERTTQVRAAEQRLERARAELKKAMSRLATVRRAALYGEHDADALDDAVLTCREAQARVRAARQQLEREWASALDDSVPQGWPAATSPDGATDGAANGTTDREPDFAPLEITSRLLFARWLVQTGRLTEQIPEPELTAAA